MKNKHRIVFILGSISQPRCIKRIKSFIANGFEVEVYGFDRGKYNQNAVIEGKRIIIVGSKKDGGNYLQKFFQTNKIIKRIVNEQQKSNTIFYSFGYVETILLFIQGVNSYIYEISDILYGYQRFKYFRWVLKSIDKFLIHNSLLTILTSKGFLDYLFSGKKNDKIIIQPNRVDSSIEKHTNNSIRGLQNSRKLTFSFVGAFRSPNTVLRFAKIIGERFPNYRFSFFGDSKLTNEVIEICNRYDNVNYYGAFKNPDDLPNIYNNTDIIISCYDTKDLNERILEPNKLYEALYFKKPIIVSSGTFLSKRVKELGCGFSINATNDDDINSFLDSLSIEKLKIINSNICKVETEDIIDDNAKSIISFLTQKLG